MQHYVILKVTICKGNCTVDIKFWVFEAKFYEHFIILNVTLSLSSKPIYLLDTNCLFIKV